MRQKSHPGACKSRAHILNYTVIPHLCAFWFSSVLEIMSFRYFFPLSLCSLYRFFFLGCCPLLTAHNWTWIKASQMWFSFRLFDVRNKNKPILALFHNDPDISWWCPAMLLPVPWADQAACYCQLTVNLLNICVSGLFWGIQVNIWLQKHQNFILVK